MRSDFPITAPRPDGRAIRRALWAAGLLMAALGVFHAWSVLVEPLQDEFGLSRSAVSAVYALATVVFAASMLLEPVVHRRVGTRAVAIGSALLAAAGLALAALPATWAVFAGYGGLFAVANGLGYGLAVHVAATLGGARTGAAAGAMVAAYALGGTLLAPVLSLAARALSLEAALGGLAVVMLAVATAQAVLLGGHGAAAIAPPSHAAALAGSGAPLHRDRTFWLLWTAFLCASAAGLVVIGHAAAITASVGGGAAALTLAASLSAGGNGVGRLAAGHLTDRVTVRAVMCAAAVLSAAALLALAAVPAVGMAVVALGVAGIAYGAQAVALPVATARHFGPSRAAAVFARVFTGWGLAGLVAPVAAGAVYDATGGYGRALVALGAISLAGAAASAALRAPPGGGLEDPDLGVVADEEAERARLRIPPPDRHVSPEQ